MFIGEGPDLNAWRIEAGRLQPAAGSEAVSLGLNVFIREADRSITKIDSSNPGSVIMDEPSIFERIRSWWNEE